MKRLLIGSVFIVLGTIIPLSILLTAAVSLPQIHQWRGSRLLYTIFSSDISGGLSLGVPFIVGLALFISGFLILAIELVNSPHKL